MPAVNELTVYNEYDGIVVPGKHGTYFVRLSDLFKVSATTTGLADDKQAVNVELKVKPKLERLREHARLLNLIADELEKTGGDSLGLHKCEDCRHCHPGEAGGTGWCTEQDAVVDQYTPRKCPADAFQRKRGA